MICGMEMRDELLYNIWIPGASNKFRFQSMFSLSEKFASSKILCFKYIKLRQLSGSSLQVFYLIRSILYSQAGISPFQFCAHSQKPSPPLPLTPLGANVNQTASTNRTAWPLTGGSVVLDLHHPWTYIMINLGLGTNYPVFNISGSNCSTSPGVTFSAVNQEINGSTTTTAAKSTTTKPSAGASLKGNSVGATALVVMLAAVGMGWLL